MSTSVQASPEAATASTQAPDPANTSSHGSSGEGAGSAMAHLISQENARIVPGASPDEPSGEA